MSIRIEPVPKHQKDTWNSAVGQSPHTTFFHQYETLDVLARHFDATVHPLMGYVGQEPIGLLPVFGQSKGPFHLATSPPLSVEISTGPALLNFEKLKRRKAEKRHQSFIDSCLEWIEAELDPDLIEIKTPPNYDDVRPFLRQDHAVTPSYTYVLDITSDEDHLIEQFSSDARSNIRNTADDEYDIREGGVEEIETIVSIIQDRFDEIDKYHYLDADLVTDLYAESGDFSVRPYACWVDDEITSGIILLEDDDTIYRWQGGSKPDTGLPVNDLLDWRIIRDGTSRDKAQYDLVGAMIPRLCEYKSKFGPEPMPLYISKKSRPTAKIAEKSYRLMPTAVRSIIGL